MKRAYLVRYGAYGDHVHMSNVIKALDQDGYHVTFEYNFKGAQIHSYNPRIDAHEMFEPGSTKATPEHFKAQARRHRWAKENCALFVNFGGSLEGALIAPEADPEYFWPLKFRRAKNTHTCYYDQSMIWSGLTEQKYMGWTGEIYFTLEEHEFMRNWLEPYRDDFLILYAFRGTMQQKAVYPLAEPVCNEFIRRHPETTIFTTGDDGCQEWEWDHPKVVHRSGRMPFRQALLMARYMDLVVTPETGLGIGAGAYGTPKIMLLTAASLKNIVGNDQNDYSLQSEAWCSPCTRAIYNVENCPVDDSSGFIYPICVNFPKDRVLDRMEEVFHVEHERNWSLGKAQTNIAASGRPEAYM